MTKGDSYTSGKYEKQSWLLKKKIEFLRLHEIKMRDWFIAGGACKSVFTSEPINDLDVFFHNEAGLNKFRIQFQRLNSINCPQFETDSAISYNIEGQKIQLIKKVYEAPEIVLRHFDFSIVQCAYCPDIDTFVMSNNFLYDNAQKKLRYSVNILGKIFPIASLVRAIKYTKRGYSFSGVEAVKLALTINNLHLESYRDLKEQLEGIDTLLLKDVTDALMGQSDKDYDFKEFLALAEEKLNRIWDNED